MIHIKSWHRVKDGSYIINIISLIITLNVNKNININKFQNNFLINIFHW